MEPRETGVEEEGWRGNESPSQVLLQPSVANSYEDRNMLKCDHFEMWRKKLGILKIMVKWKEIEILFQE